MRHEFNNLTQIIDYNILNNLKIDDNIIGYKLKSYVKDNNFHYIFLESYSKMKEILYRKTIK
jgi:hypothetical protein